MPSYTHAPGIHTEKNLRFSLFDGIAYGIMFGMTQDFFTPFLLCIGGTATHAGFLSALPNLSASLVQIVSPSISEHFKSRRVVIIACVFLQALLLLPLIAYALAGGINPYIFILTVVLFSTTAALALPAWNSMMSDIVDEKRRGEYFGWRSRIVGIATLLSAFFAGCILHYNRHFSVFTGFAVIFSAAFSARMASCFFLTRMREPAHTILPHEKFTFIEFLSRGTKSNFLKFVFFTAAVNFSAFIAVPFFSVFMLRDLRFSYLRYTSVIVWGALVSYLLAKKWGKCADTIGTVAVMRFTAPIIAFLPLLWVFSHNILYLFIIQTLSGFAWSGFNLCATNFIFDAAGTAKRTRAFAYYSAINGTAMCLGALTGGLLIARLPSVAGNRILTLFIFSSVLRLISALAIPLHIQEVRPITSGSPMRFFLFPASRIKR